ncbi:LuxR C-terminal-related transcriptional regulator [Microbacterium sp. NPDC076911]|uniref:LuxR C-terminal-related transcriptional regulator n=1 Tax=Microbacterium sp. NPDC076911 TaxID=3154958 RepID=UPI00342E4DEE
MSTIAPAAPTAPTAALTTSLRFASAERAIVALTSVDKETAVRGVLSGNAGSGKSVALRRTRALLAEQGRASTRLRADTNVAAIPPGEVLLVDDAHLLDAEVLRELVARAEDPEAALVVAARSWPAPAALTALVRTLEHSGETVLLSDAMPGDVRASLAGTSPSLASTPRCEDRVLHDTGGIAWLAHECINAHANVACRGAEDHDEIDRAIELRIAHVLDLVSPEVGQLIEDLAVGGTAEVAPELIAEGCAEGLLLRNGLLAPLVAGAARRRMPAHRLVELVRTGAIDYVPDPSLADGFESVRDTELAKALAARAVATIPTDPNLAITLFDRARACGADDDETLPGRVYAAWAAGRLDDVGALLDGREFAPDYPQRQLVADVAASSWVERGIMPLADQTYRAFALSDEISRTHALLAAAGAGRLTAETHASDAPAAAAAAPSTIAITMNMLERGLRSTFTADAPTTALTDLPRASELYTASRTSTPIPELPAVIAAITAIGVGDLATAHAVVHDAIRDQQGGLRQQPHLHLWCAWVSLQRERPADAREALRRATADGHTLLPRDDALAAAITVGLARRHEDSAGLASAWESVKARLQRTEPDLYTLLPLGELIISAARVGDIAWAQCAFDSGLRIVAELGDPPLWSAPLHWAGIQRGILLNQPADLAPHAKALVAAATHNRLAAMMAQAGRVWTAVLSGHVDPEAVEVAAQGLASVGLAWDGARLAGHGAGRSDDRKVIARLLACARDLHPRETPRADSPPTASPAAEASADEVLSEREREVAELVIQGKTYAEIGEAIFISPRTAEHHIAHIRRRVNATSRSELLSKLRIILEDGAA